MYKHKLLYNKILWENLKNKSDIMGKKNKYCGRGGIDLLLN